jgi:hypothetical protein
MLTAGSSVVLPFQATQLRGFEAWRETWHRQVLADRELGHRDKSVAGFLLWYLNRQERACFPSYSTIAEGVGIDRRDAVRSIARLVACGHLLRRLRERQSNYYSPQVVAPCHQGVGVPCHQDSGAVPPGGGGKSTTLTSDYRTSDLTLEDREERKGGLPRGKEEKKARPSVASSPSPSLNNQDVPRGAPNGGGGDSTFVKFDTPQWDMVERFGHKAVGKFFMRYGRSEGLWLLKSDLKAIEAAAAANGGGR